MMLLDKFLDGKTIGSVTTDITSAHRYQSSIPGHLRTEHGNGGYVENSYLCEITLHFTDGTHFTIRSDKIEDEQGYFDVAYLDVDEELLR